MRKLDMSKVPEHIRPGIEMYIREGRPVGKFLSYVICNKLKESFMYADEININRMFDIVNFFYNQAPFSCWGSEEKMKAWIEQGGENGPTIESP